MMSAVQNSIFVFIFSQSLRSKSDRVKVAGCCGARFLPQAICETPEVSSRSHQEVAIFACAGSMPASPVSG